MRLQEGGHINKSLLVLSTVRTHAHGHGHAHVYVHVALARVVLSTASPLSHAPGRICAFVHACSQVIQKLSEGFNKHGVAPAHIPYRSSKITRILQNSLGADALADHESS